MVIKIMDEILDFLEEIVYGLTVGTVMIVTFVTFPIWAIPYAVIRRRKNGETRGD